MSLMKIAEIEQHLESIKNQALIDLGVPAEQAQEIALADAPNPEMGDRGFPTFALARVLRKGPPMIAQEITQKLSESLASDELIAEVIAAGPYVNFKLNPAKLAQIIIEQAQQETDQIGKGFIKDPTHWMIEYSAPNTNKPQHLGHVRNDLLGESVAQVLDFAGNKVTRVNLINDRGIHICKSMLMYQMFGEGQTPESTGKKGDHFVGYYYVMFGQKFDEEYNVWKQGDEAQTLLSQWLESEAGQKAAKEITDTGKLHNTFFKTYKDTYFNTQSTLGHLTRSMLVAWEDNDADVRALWETMNQWVFDGFDETYKRLGVAFDKVYYESDTYILGKGIVEQGLKDGIFHTIDGGAIACDLEKIGLSGDKILQRSNGTSVYMTQDLGTALKRFEEHDVDSMAYVVGDEQRHHFQVLFGILALLKPELEGKMHHISYGMVELPKGLGRMKTREGTTVDADDLMSAMFEEALTEVKERYPDLDEDEQHARAEAIGMASLKFFILYFNRTTTVHFDPKEAIDFKGKTGPYIMYAYARIQSIARELGGWPELPESADLIKICSALGTKQELDLLNRLRAWPHSLEVATRDLDPSKIAGFAYDLASDFSTMYNHKDHKIKDMDGDRRTAQLLLCRATGNLLETALKILGIEVLEQM